MLLTLPLSFYVQIWMAISLLAFLLAFWHCVRKEEDPRIYWSVALIISLLCFFFPALVLITIPFGFILTIRRGIEVNCQPVRPVTSFS